MPMVLTPVVEVQKRIGLFKTYLFVDNIPRTSRLSFDYTGRKGKIRTNSRRRHPIHVLMKRVSPVYTYIHVQGREQIEESELLEVHLSRDCLNLVMDIALDVECSLNSNPLSLVTALDGYNDSVVPSPRRRSADIRLVASHPDVYEPCDDSFALVDALLADRVHLWELQPSICLEVGCGSGYVITSLALMIGDIKKVKYIATDISEAAVKTTCTTLAAHNVNADVVVADLVSGLENHLAGAVDVLVFNPPYVPTSDDEVRIGGIASAWAGGDRGRVVIDRILDVVDLFLSSKGWFYLVTVTANNPGEICQIMRRKGFASRIVIQRSTEEESLHVLKFWREVSKESVESSFGPVSPSGRTPLQRSLSQRLSRLVSFK